jgi:hypothetical protein
LIIYLIKTKGTSIIPEFVQMRDNNFVLVSHFRVDKADNAIEKSGLGKHKDRIIEIIKELSFGVLYKVNLI